MIGCASSADAQVRRAAVLDFVNNNKDPALDYLGPVAADTLTHKLAAIRSLQLVERLQLYQILQEQRLQLTDLVDPSQAVRLGKLLGAEQVVLGSYSAIGGMVRFTVRFVDVETGSIVSSSQETGALDARDARPSLALLDRLAHATVDALNTRVVVEAGRPRVEPVEVARRIEPTPEERRRLAGNPTTNALAVEAYGRGLDALKRGDLREASARLSEVVRLDPGHAQAWTRLALVLGQRGDLVEAERAGAEAVRLNEARGNGADLAAALNTFGGVRSLQKRHADALALWGKGLEINERSGNLALIALSAQNVGTGYALLDRPDEALAQYERALGSWRQLRDEKSMAATLTSIGYIYQKRNRLSDALKAYSRAREIQERLGDEIGLTKTLNNLGALALAQGRVEDALAVYRQSMALSEKLGEDQQLPISLGGIGAVLGMRKQHREMLPYFERRLALLERMGDEAAMADTLFLLGVAYWELGDHRAAMAYADRAVALAQRLNLPQHAQWRRQRDEALSSLRRR